MPAELSVPVIFMVLPLIWTPCPGENLGFIAALVLSSPRPMRGPYSIGAKAATDEAKVVTDGTEVITDRAKVVTVEAKVVTDGAKAATDGTEVVTGEAEVATPEAVRHPGTAPQPVLPPSITRLFLWSSGNADGYPQ
jgi:hypothetical protein